MKLFSIKKAINFAWEKVKENLWFLIGLELIVFLVNFVGKSNWASFLISIFTTFVTASVYLRTKRGTKVDFKNLFETLSAQKFLHFLVAMVIAYILIFFGFVLLIVPGIIMATALCMTSFIVIDKEIKDWKGKHFWEAIKESIVMTKGHRMHLFKLFVVLVGLNILGVIALGVGVLITMPITGITMAYVYDVLKQGGKEPVRNEAPAPSSHIS